MERIMSINETKPQGLDSLRLKKITGIHEILDLYQGFIVDLWGVVHDGFNPYPGAVECLNHMIHNNKTLLFVSNAPRPSNLLIQKLQEFGINATVDMIYSSGDLTRYQLTLFEDPFFKGLGRVFYQLGAECNTDLLAGLSLDVTSNLENADIMIITSFMDEGDDLNQYDTLLEKALHLGIPAICPNPDTVLITAGKYRYCAGFIAEKFEAMGGRVRYYGKPHAMIYEKSFEKFKAKGIQNKKRILAIGDTFETDILGGENFGCDTALVTTGNVARLVAEEAAAKISKGVTDLSVDELLPNLVRKFKVHPKWLLPGLIY